MAVHRAATLAALRPAIDRVPGRDALPAPLNDPDTLTRSVAAIYDAALMGVLTGDNAGYARDWLRAMFTLIVGPGDAASVPAPDPGPDPDLGPRTDEEHG
jgi:hypothetical protein